MKTENRVVINRIGIGRVGFTIESECLKTLGDYDLKMKADLPGGETELSLKITIIEITKGVSGKCECHAIFRNLTAEQLLTINEIVDYYAVEIRLRLSDIEAVIAV